jgi:hypothetical protein
MGISYDKLRYLVGMLNQVDPQGYKQLAQDLRDAGGQLRGGGPLGGGQIEGDAQPPPPEGQYSTKEACVIAASALQRVRTLVTPNIAKIGARLRASNTIGLVGEIVAAVGTAGVITAIWGAPPKDSVGHITSICLGLVALGGTIASLVARYLRRDISGADGTLAGAYRKLIDGAWEAEIISAKLEAIISKGVAAGSTKEAPALIERAEKLAAEMWRTVNDSGVPIGHAA